MKNKPISVRDVNNHKACNVFQTDDSITVEIKRKDAITRVVIVGPSLATTFYSYPADSSC